MRYLLADCGFYLRHEAILRFWELKGKPIYFHFITRVVDEDIYWYADEPFPESYNESHTSKEHAAWVDAHRWDPINVDRTDPHLHQVAEEMPNLVAMGHYRLVEVPDDVDAVIMCSDTGYEWVAERHRTWS